jgi:hypothetical protein
MIDLINEAEEYKFGTELFNYILGIFPSLAGQQKAAIVTLKKPDELIYQKPKIKIGFAIHLLLNHMNVHPYQLSQFLNTTNNSTLETSAEQIINNSYSGFKVRVVGVIPPRLDQDRTMGAVNYDDELIFFIMLNPILMNDQQLFASVLRHELQHLSGNINGISLIYYRRLKKLNFDLSKLEKLERSTLSDYEKTYMFKKIVNSRVKIRNKKSREEFKSYLENPSLDSDDKNFREYVSSDAEYKQHLSDIINALTKGIIGAGKLSDYQTSNFIISLYNTAMKGDIAKGTIDVLNHLIRTYDKSDDTTKRIFTDLLGTGAFYHYMESPHYRKILLKDLKRYLPIRMKKLFDTVFNGKYIPFPESEKEKQEAIQALKKYFKTQYVYIKPGTYE